MQELKADSEKTYIMSPYNKKEDGHIIHKRLNYYAHYSSLRKNQRLYHSTSKPMPTEFSTNLTLNNYRIAGNKVISGLVFEMLSLPKEYITECLLSRLPFFATSWTTIEGYEILYIPTIRPFCVITDLMVKRLIIEILDLPVLNGEKLDSLSTFLFPEYYALANDYSNPIIDANTLYEYIPERWFGDDFDITDFSYFDYNSPQYRK
jgi:hypothetical protein